MRHLDLFSGIGGFALSASWVWGEQHEIHSFVEIEPFCQKVLKKHWPEVQIHDDIKTYKHDGTAIDLLTGGPPCQRTSVASAIQGKRTGETLWPEMARIIKLCSPNWIVVEQPSGNKEWEVQVENDLESLSYGHTRLKRQALFCGAPHSRRRTFIIANSGFKRLQQVARFRASLPADEKTWPTPPRGAWRSARTGNCRVDDGISDWVDRIKALGNAIVPQVVVPIMQAIKQIYDQF